MNNTNVTKTRRLGLCISCEICSALCPVNAVTCEYWNGQFLPRVDEDKCTQCGLCLDVCPGIDIDPFSSKYEHTTISIFDGPSLATYTAYSKNEHIRKNSVSGGMVTTLITELIKAEDWDEAFVLPFDTFDGTAARLKATDNPEEIFNAAKSKYLPASVYEVIKTLEKRENKRYIIVGTPCLLSGIKKYVRLKNMSEDNLLLLGLFCEKTLNYNLIRHLEETYRKAGESLVKLEYRTKEKYGWPGNVKLIFDSGRELILSRKVRMRLKRYFQLNRCLFCLDKLNISADIAFGDCYIKGARDKLGISSVIVRTDKGRDVLKKYSHLFVLEREHIFNIRKSQSLGLKRDNLEYAKIWAKRHKICGEAADNYIPDTKARKRLAKLQKYINWGEHCNFRKIKYSKQFWTVAGLFRLGTEAAGILIAVIITALKFLFLSITGCLRKTKKSARGRKNVVIVGGQLYNKGAQAMTFTVVDQIRRRFPDKDIYLLHTKDFERDDQEKQLYNFGVLPWSPKSRIRLLLGSAVKDNSGYAHMEKEVKQVLSNSACIIDVSGFALSSQRGFYSSLGYLINILIAKKWSIPFYVFPQSFGPLNYPLWQKLILYPLLKICLSYPKSIFLREKMSVKLTQRFTKSNVEFHFDIVLQNSKYNLSNIYSGPTNFEEFAIKPDSVGIIPNIMVANRIEEKKLYTIYQSLVHTLIKAGKNVYILRHSWEDLPICEKIKSFFANDTNVKLIPGDLSAPELEGIIRQFDFVVASRYHSIIHSYRNNVPAIVIGWTEKYPELLREFGQSQYYFDCRYRIEADEINNKLNEMIKSVADEKERISKRRGSLSQKDVFNVLKDDLT